MIKAASNSEFVPQRKLRRPRGHGRVHCPPQSRREQRVRRNPEMCSIEQIEDLRAEFHLMPFGETEEFIDGQIGVDYAGGAECVAPDRSVNARSRQHTELFEGCGGEFIPQ
jgi:hypothetical protein